MLYIIGGFRSYKQNAVGEITALAAGLLLPLNRIIVFKDSCICYTVCFATISK